MTGAELGRKAKKMLLSNVKAHPGPRAKGDGEWRAYGRKAKAPPPPPKKEKKQGRGH